MRGLVADQDLNVFVKGDPAEEAAGSDFRVLHELRKPLELLGDLVSQLPCFGNDQALMRQIAPFELGLHQVQNAEGKDCGLPRACLGLVDDVVALNDRWDGLDLDGARILEAHFL